MTAEVGQFARVRSLRAAAGNIYVAQALSTVVAMATSVLIARELGPTDKGVVDLFNVLVGFIVELGLLGFGSGLLFELINRGRRLAAVHGTGIVVCMTLGAVTMLVGLTLLPTWRSVFPQVPTWGIAAAFVMAPFLYYRLVWQNLMTGLNRAPETFWLGLALGLLGLAVMGTLWITGHMTVTSVLIASIALTVFTAAVMAVVLLHLEPRLAFEWKAVRGSARFGAVIYLATIANVLHFKVDQVLVNHWLGTAAVGVYGVSVRLAESLFLLDTAIVTAALYRIATDAEAESVSLSQRVLRAQAAISGAFGLVLVILAYPLVHVLYGDAYGGAVVPLMVLVPGIVAWSAAKAVSTRMGYREGRVGFLAVVAVAGMVLNIVLNVVFIRGLNLGITGAATASSISYVSSAVVIVLVGRSSSRRSEVTRAHA